MNKQKYDLLAVGNALVDVLAKTTEDFVTEQSKTHGMIKGAMTLIDKVRAESLYADMGAGTEMSGGSAANTMAGFASFGGNGAFIGKVAKDQLGDVFKHDMQAMGLDYATTPLVAGESTGRCLVLITPDAERTMNTYLGASIEFCENDIDKAKVAASKVVYLEGYLFDKPQAKRAYALSSSVACQSGAKVALTLSDAFCVDRHRDDFKDLINDHIDILLCNEDEIYSLCKTNEMSTAIEAIKSKCEISVITRGAKGSIIVSGDEIIEVAPEPVNDVVDSTGAGDQYAAGFLYGYTQNMPLQKCGTLGSKAAAEVISHIGSRPARPYKELLS